MGSDRLDQDPEQPRADGARSADRPAIREKIERYGRLAAVLLVVVGLAIRVRGLSEYWLNADEGIYYSTLTWSSFGRFWSEVMANAHPPAFYLLLRFLSYLTWDFVWLRGVSVMFGVAAIWTFWLVGRELGGGGVRGTVAGVVAAALLALNPDAIALSQVIRPYMLVIFLLSAGLLSLLRYRSRPSDETLIAYAALLTLAALSHYSAALGFGVLSVLLAHDLLTGRVKGDDAGKLLLAHGVPSVILATLYLFHLRAVLGSDLMDQAFDQGGWLVEWLVDSPEAGWRSLVTFQNFHVPVPFRVRTALLLLFAIGLSAFTRDRAVALLAGSAIAIALAVSTLGVYPFGPSRHNAWLTVFTMPTLGWIAGRLVRPAPLHPSIALGAILVLFFGGIPLERALGGAEARAVAVGTNATEERVLRSAAIAPLIVERMDPEGQPGTIVMTEQSYNVLMPLYAIERQDATFAADSSLFHFDYGMRDVVVIRKWDWSGLQDVVRWLDAIPDALPSISWNAASPVQVLAGGWSSTLLSHVPALLRDGIVTELTWAIGPNPAGQLTTRMIAMIVDWDALSATATSGY